MANIEQSIKVGNGFALKAPSPVDLKTTAATIAERDSYVSQGFGYPGMIVYVEADDTYYKYTGSAWVKFLGETASASEVVKLTGDQTIDGVKTFNDAPKIGTKTVTTVEDVDTAISTKLTTEIGTSIQAHHDNLDKLSALSANGIVVKTADGFVNRALESDSLTITNTDGTAGNPKIELSDSGVTAGDYTKVTVDAKGVVTAGSNPTTLTGYGITDAVSKAGDTVTGKLTYSGVDETTFANNDLVTKQYVDKIAEGHVPHEACEYAYITNIEGTYADGSDSAHPGVGATFTPTTPDASLAENDRVLLAGQTDAKQNGVYTVNADKSLTRASDLDGNPSQEVYAGASFFILAGANKGATFSLANKNVVFGTTELTFVQTNAQIEYSAGAGISITGTSISVKQGTTVSVIGGKLEVSSGTGNKDKVLVAGEDGTAATYKEISLNTVTGTLSVAKGGTGATTLDANKIILGNGADPVAFVENQEGVLVGTASGAPSFGKANLTTHVEGILPVANGGTGASTKAGAFDALAPTVSKGDLIVNNGTANVAMSAGADGTILVADSTSSTGYTWTNVIRGGTF